VASEGVKVKEAWMIAKAWWVCDQGLDGVICDDHIHTCCRGSNNVGRVQQERPIPKLEGEGQLDK
jgi:hypothetical protein